MLKDFFFTIPLFNVLEISTVVMGYSNFHARLHTGVLDFLTNKVRVSWDSVNDFAQEKEGLLEGERLFVKDGE